MDTPSGPISRLVYLLVGIGRGEIEGTRGTLLKVNSGGSRKVYLIQKILTATFNGAPLNGVVLAALCWICWRLIGSLKESVVGCRLPGRDETVWMKVTRPKQRAD